MKKGQIETQFNWMFVLIIGAIILAFFFNLVIKHKEIADSKISLNLINDIETIATGAGVSRGTAQTLNKPDVDLEFDCMDCDCYFQMKNDRKGYEGKIIFSPNYISGRKWIAWTQDWGYPFRVTNILFVTSPQIIYYLIYDSSDGDSKDLKDFVNESLPSSLNVEYVDKTSGIPDTGVSSSVIDYNYPQVRLVYLDIDKVDLDGNVFSGFDEEDITAVKLNPDASDYVSGKVSFYRYDEDSSSFEIDKYKFIDDVSDHKGEDVSYLDEKSLFAAMFSHSFLIYDCNMKTAYKQMSRVGDIFKTRIENLDSTSCPTTEVDGAVENLAELVGYAEDISEGTDKISDLKTIAETIDSQNRQYGISGCPGIY